MKRIAIVDDELNDIEVLGAMLNSRGFHTYCFVDPLLLAQSPLIDSFDLLIVDLVMPGLNGHELFRQIRAIQPTMPIIALSAHVVPESIAEAEATGFVAFFPKPILDMERFCRDIGRLMSS